MSKSPTTTAGKAALGPVGLAQMRRAPSHPGEVFEEDFRKPSGLSQAEAARRMGMSTNRLNELVKGKRGVTAETAILFGEMTGTSPEFWLAMQTKHDLWKAYQLAGKVKRIAPGEPFPVASR
jgi:addiction module HigA family antidote